MGTFTLFRIRGIPIRIHFTLLFLLAWLILQSVTNGDWTLAVFIGGVALSVLLHELGHALTAQYFKIPILSIMMFPTGGLAQMGRMPAPAEDIWVTAMGPAVNAVLWIVLEPLGWRELAQANLFLFLFNLLPAFPLDGGRLVRAILAHSKPWDAATSIVAYITFAVAIPLGIYALVNGQIFLAFLAFMMFSAAQAERAASAAFLPPK
jgi:Zn-dependent protease